MTSTRESTERDAMLLEDSGELGLEVRVIKIKMENVLESRHQTVRWETVHVFHNVDELAQAIGV